MKKFVFFLLLSFSFLLVTSGLFVAEPLRAQTSGNVSVGADVHTDVAPSVPELISPANNSTLFSTMVTFVWEESSDINGIDHYELTIDGIVIFNDIPTSDTDNLDYTLTYNSSTGEYTLELKSQIPYGSHTWKITAVNNNEVSTDSDTWNFTISQVTPSPTPSSEPTTEPSGSPEATPESTPEVTPSPTPFINLTPSPSPFASVFPSTVLEPGGSSTPSASTTPEPSASPTPEPESPVETIIKTVSEVREQTIETIKKAIESLPPAIAQAVETVAETTKDLLPAAAITAIAVSSPLQIFLSLLSQLGSNFSLDFILKFLQAIGLIPAGKPKGYVFDSKTKSPVPFAILTIQSIGEVGKQIQETLVTNVYGFYKGIALPPGNYTIDVNHQNYTFPTRLARPIYLSPDEFYKGEQYSVTEQSTKRFHLIPVDPIQTEKTRASFLDRIRLGVLFLNRMLKFATFPLFIVSAFAVFFIPSVINWLILGIYTTLLGIQLIPYIKPANLTGNVVDEHGEAIENALIKISSSKNSEIIAVGITDQKGRYKFSVKPGNYEITVSKDNYTWIQDESYLSFASVQVGYQKVQTTQTMKKAVITESDIFG